MRRGGVQLAAIERRRTDADHGFPFSVPCIASLERLELDAAVTLLVGENGSGKSTFLEALAIAAELPAVGSAALGADPTLAAQRRLADRLRLTWRGRTRRGFFLRAEDFFGFQKLVARQRSEHEAELESIDAEWAEASELARTLAKGPHRSSIAGMDARYGERPDARSHGEAFLDVFRARLRPGGLHLLDEPEAALSPQSQLGFLAMLRDAVAEGAQFVVATHSPILMAIPGAAILSFDEPPVRRVAFSELESVDLVRRFLAEPERYLRLVWPAEENGASRE
ncbi:MAG TPA: AAA family ATPase [Longimicrobiales bacterium]|nr:AAA family ATPase [Longimicrobiales bacterium]